MIFHKVLIGKQIANTSTYILNEYLQPTPVGVIGELYIGGDGLAKGYLNRPDLTAEKFIDNPFGEGKLYKTGDLCRYLPDGNIEFIGRIDNQVKIRGFRVELGEIEATLDQYEKIKETVVLAKEKEKKEKYLVAYITSHQKISASLLREYLGDKLPDYMIPNAFVFLDEFPLTPNGKIDTKALPNPNFETQRENEYIPPSRETEITLASIWQEILGVKKIGINDNFFSLGGHSLLATQVISRIRNQFNIELPLRNLFEYPTISQLALEIDKQETNIDTIEIPIISRDDTLSLSFAQERLWFITQLEGNSTFYNISRVMKLAGKLNIDAISRAITHLVKRHESLRSNFFSQEGKPYLKINSASEGYLEIIDAEQLSTSQIDNLIKEKRNKILDLENDRLIQFSLLPISATENILVILIHHIISDGWSMGILTSELSKLYQTYSQNKTPNLEKLEIRYADFASWQRGYLQGEKLDRQLNYWQEKLKDIPPLLELPTDNPRPVVQTYQGKTLSLDLSSQLIEQLKQISQEEETTLFMTMVTAFSILLSRYTNQDDIVIGTPIANRHYPEVENIIGFFANTLPIRITLEKNQTFTELLAQVKQTTLESYQYQDIPFEKLVEELNPQRSLSYNPIFQVMLAWNNIPAQSEEWGDLTIQNQKWNNSQIGSAKFDLSLFFNEKPQEIKAGLNYNSNLFNDDRIEGMSTDFTNLLSAIVENPQQSLSQLQILIKDIDENNSNRNSKQLSCILIGWESLILNCANWLSDRGHIIKGIISNGNLVRKWAKEHEISYASSLKDNPEWLSPQSCDYLFSIYNLEILPPEILAIPRQYAINCHDALLPKYAGMNAVSWAILNGERQHGITWHIMTEDIDAGDILKQISFDIDEDETAFSLNTKCFENLIASFPQLIDDLLRGKITPKPQSKENIQLFLSSQKPAPNCIVNWNLSAKEIDTQFRALKYEQAPNYIGRFKIFIESQFYLVNQLEISNQKSEKKPGTIVSFTNKTIVITTKTNDVIVSDFMTLDGQCITRKEIFNQHNLHLNYLLPSLTEEEARYINELDKKITNKETYWVNKLINLEPLRLSNLFLNYSESNHKSTHSYKFFTIDLPTLNEYKENTLINKDNHNILLTFLLTYLHRISRAKSWDINIQTEDNLTAIATYHNLYSSYLPWKIELDLEKQIDSLIQDIDYQLKKLKKQQIFPLDIFDRYPELQERKELISEYHKNILIQINHDDTTAITIENKQPLIFNIKTETSQIECIYNCDLINDHEIKIFLDNFLTFAENLLKNYNLPIGKIPLISSDKLLEYQHQNYQQELTKYSPDLFIQQWEKQVQQSPHRIAIQEENNILTYSQLNNKVNQLAHYIQQKGVKVNSLIAICLPRSIQQITSILAVLKAGGAYIPLDINYPQERIKFICEDTQTPLIITLEKFKAKLPHNTEHIYLDINQQQIAKQPTDNLDSRDLQGSDLAYIIHTSGTTGNPKGVMINQESLGYFAQIIGEAYCMTKSDRILQFANICFDMSIEEIFSCFVKGGTLVLRNEEMLSDAQQFIRQIEDWQITIIILSTAYWSVIVREIDRQKLSFPSCLKLTIIGGEKVTRENIQLWQDNIPPQIQLINGYGPTETTVTVTTININSTTITPEKSIGKPLAGVTAYILDDNLQPLPVGVPGELCLGGYGLANGYLNQPKLTAEKFIDNPFVETRHPLSLRLYKTGDLCRYLPDGNIEYIGRIDNQVKVRGFRIELGEIEASLNKFKNVKQTVVIVKEKANGDKYLAAYLVSENAVTNTELREYLGENLPGYMIPSVFVFLDEFPLTLNGKIDKKALYDIEAQENRDNEYIAPINETEIQLVEIWQKILEVENIGIKDNFFNLGGHSLLATQVVSRIRNNFQIELPLRYLFEYPTIKQLAEIIEEEKLESNSIDIPIISREGELPLSFAQERLWFINQLEGNSTVYNIPTVTKLQGVLNITALEKTIQYLVKRHESLRSNFINLEGKPYLEIHRDNQGYLEIIDGENKSPSEIEEIVNGKKNQILDLEKDKLIQFTLLQISATENILVTLIHHIISDGWSRGILTSELSKLYQVYSQNKTPNLEELEIQYVDFAQWQRKYLQGEKLDRQLNYWQEKLKNIPPLLELPTDNPRPVVQNYQGKSLPLDLSSQLIEQLKQISQEEETTLFMTMVTAFSILLSRYTNQDDIVIGTPIANRNYAQTEDIIGFFANTLALRINLEKNVTFRDLLAQVKETTLSGYEHQDLPFEKLVEELNPVRSMSYNPIFQVMLAWNNTKSKSEQWGDVKVKNQRLESWTNR